MKTPLRTVTNSSPEPRRVHSSRDSATSSNTGWWVKYGRSDGTVRENSRSPYSRVLLRSALVHQSTLYSVRVDHVVHGAWCRRYETHGGGKCFAPETQSHSWDLGRGGRPAGAFHTQKKLDTRFYLLKNRTTFGTSQLRTISRPKRGEQRLAAHRSEHNRVRPLFQGFQMDLLHGARGWCRNGDIGDYAT